MADEATTGADQDERRSRAAPVGLAASLIGTVLSGRYRLESKLGSGGMSTVFLARDETLERWVAVKVMHREMSDQPDQIERFRREARSVAQLSHPNVVAVIDGGEGEDYARIDPGDQVSNVEHVLGGASDSTAGGTGGSIGGGTLT